MRQGAHNKTTAVSSSCRNKYSSSGLLVTNWLNIINNFPFVLLHQRNNNNIAIFFGRLNPFSVRQYTSRENFLSVQTIFGWFTVVKITLKLIYCRWFRRLCRPLNRFGWQCAVAISWMCWLRFKRQKKLEMWDQHLCISISSESFHITNSWWSNSEMHRWLNVWKVILSGD